MPIYRIECNNCGLVKEVICKFDELDDLLCEKCGSKIKQIPASVAFKIEGYNASNGYSGPEEFNYAGDSCGW